MNRNTQALFSILIVSLLVQTVAAGTEPFSTQASGTNKWQFATANESSKDAERLQRNADRTLEQLNREKNRTIENVERDIKQREKQTARYAAKNASKSASFLTELTQGARQSILQPLKNDLAPITNQSLIKAIALRYCVDQGCPNGTNFHLDARYAFAQSLAQINDTLHQSRAKVPRFGPAGLAAIQMAEANLTAFKAFANTTLADPKPYSNATRQRLREQNKAVNQIQQLLRKAFDPRNDLEKLKAQIKPTLLNQTQKAVAFYRNMTRNDVTRGILLDATPIIAALDHTEAQMIAAIHAEVDAANSTAMLNRLSQGFCDNSHCPNGILSLHNDFVHGFGLKAQQLVEFAPYAAQEGLADKIGPTQVLVAEAQAFIESVGAYAFDYNASLQTNRDDRNASSGEKGKPGRNESQRQWVEAQKKRIDMAMKPLEVSMRAYWQERFAEKKAQALQRIQVDEGRVQFNPDRYNGTNVPRTSELVQAVLQRARTDIMEPLKRDTQAATTSAQVQTARRKYCLEHGCPTGLNFHLNLRIQYAQTEASVLEAENDTQRFGNRTRVTQARALLTNASAGIESLGASPTTEAQAAIREALAQVRVILMQARTNPDRPQRRPWPTATPGNATANGTTASNASLTKPQPTPNANYYLRLERQCDERARKVGTNETPCCIESVNAMRQAGVRESRNGRCEKEMVLQAARCPSAYAWCSKAQPAEG